MGHFVRCNQVVCILRHGRYITGRVLCTEPLVVYFKRIDLVLRYGVDGRIKNVIDPSYNLLKLNQEDVK